MPIVHCIREREAIGFRSGVREIRSNPNRSSQHDDLWIGALELAQQPVAALHVGVQRRLGRFLAADVMLFRPFKSGLGQNAKYSSRIDVYRFASELGHCSRRSALRICAKGGIEL
jgi:hypothetical protein